MAQDAASLAWDQIKDAAARRFSSEPRPFLKWAGSKQALLKHLVDFVPREFENYYEPFLGGGALFFLLEPTKAYLSDACAPLVETFKAVKKNPGAVLRNLSGRKPTKSHYYETRSNASRGEFKKAADFIFLNKACWNGLYRVNSDGEFNVPFGWPRTNHIVDPSNLRACAQALKAATLTVADFGKAVERAKENDLVFFDPPYVTGHNNNGFRDWNETLFSWADQQRLALLARKLADRGVHVIVSNAHHAEILKLYRGFKLYAFNRSSTLASDSNKRRTVQEVIFYTDH
jgi:DNA adenine methylase